MSNVRNTSIIKDRKYHNFIILKDEKTSLNMMLKQTALIMGRLHNIIMVFSEGLRDINTIKCEQ
jgi:polysaccharide pyruvyl transferase WcaK-like protein